MQEPHYEYWRHKTSRDLYIVKLDQQRDVIGYVGPLYGPNVAAHEFDLTDPGWINADHESFEYLPTMSGAWHISDAEQTVRPPLPAGHIICR